MKLVQNAKLQTLSRLTPPINYFTEFIDKKDNYNRKNAEDCAAYHQRVIEFIPSHRAEAYAMLGFCLERKGDLNGAVKAYDNSLKLNPAYFWTYYNLGAIYYNQKKYTQAAQYFEQAINQDPRVAAIVPLMSKVYKDVTASAPELDYSISTSLLEGYDAAGLFLVEALYRAKDYNHMFEVALKMAEDQGEKNKVFLYYAGLAAYQLKIYDKSLVLFEKFLKSNPSTWEVSYYLGLNLKAMGKDEFSDNFLKRAEYEKKKGLSSLPDVSRAFVKFF